MLAEDYFKTIKNEHKQGQKPTTNETYNHDSIIGVWSKKSSNSVLFEDGSCLQIQEGEIAVHVVKPTMLLKFMETEIDEENALELCCLLKTLASKIKIEGIEGLIVILESITDQSSTMAKEYFKDNAFKSVSKQEFITSCQGSKTIKIGSLLEDKFYLLFKDASLAIYNMQDGTIEYITTHKLLSVFMTGYQTLFEED